MTKKKTVKEKIFEEEDFIYCPRLGNSLKKLIDKNPEGVSNERIAKVLMMTEEEVEETYENALKKFRKALGINLDK